MSADSGVPGAQRVCGGFYQDGDGVAKDLTKAVEYFQLASNQGEGDVEAQCELGNCYLLGRGVQQSLSSAVLWLNKAARSGCTVTGPPAEQLEKLLANPTVSKPSSEVDSCPVCMEEFGACRTPFATRCNHVYCFGCLLEIFDCAICRRKIGRVGDLCLVTLEE